MKYTLYKRRFTEDGIDDMSSGVSEIDVTDRGYTVVKKKDGYKFFQLNESNSFTLDKTSGYETDPYFKTLYKTENDVINSKNFFYSAFWGGQFPFYEYGAMSNNESELFAILKELNIEQALEGVYLIKQGMVKYSYRYKDIFPLGENK